MIAEPLHPSDAVPANSSAPADGTVAAAELGTGRVISIRNGRAEVIASGLNDPIGVARQLVAIAASGDRSAALGSISVPTLVIHGRDDPLVDVSGGRATARAIPGSDLAVLDGMGHDLPRPVWRPVIDALTENIGNAASR